MRIKFSGLRPITVDRQTFSAWFPQLSGMHGIDGDELVEDLDTRLQHRYGIPSRMIEYTLSELFKKLGHYSCFDSGQKQKRLIQRRMDWTTSDLSTEEVGSPLGSVARQLSKFKVVQK